MSIDVEPEATRRQKGGKRARTRAALVEAASRLIAEKGYEQVGLEDVAAAAGLSRGAIYYNFKSRDELFLAVVQVTWTPIVAPLIPGVGLHEQMSAAGRYVAREARKRRRHAATALAFRHYLLRQEDLRRRVAAANDKIFARIEDELLKVYPASAFPMPVSDWVRAAYALTDGLVFAYFADPEAFPEVIFVAAFEALAGGG
jgi:AcrR family transcriptional regulator